MREFSTAPEIPNLNYDEPFIPLIHSSIESSNNNNATLEIANDVSFMSINKKCQNKRKNLNGYTEIFV